MDAAALNAFLASDFPQVANDYRVEAVDEAGLICRMIAGPQHLRPGGTVSGPSMFGLVDLAVYLLILSRIGPVGLAVTTNASIDFMRKPRAGRDLLVETRLLKLGRSLAVADGLVRAEGDEAILARASMTYSIPPRDR
ncbi:PaaI family thioesterase [Paracoccus suum]|uniref:PaaI family thioesterase n=2 Tax=Paracoccus suum TaxID=2259340 RepID=A0A344PNK6_9RHOB|nr:PaaI family thioesterase [Paracoccus suum]